MDKKIREIILAMEQGGKVPGVLIVGEDAWEAFDEWVQGLYSNVTGARVNCDGLRIVINGNEIIVHRCVENCGIVLYGIKKV